MQAVSDEFKQMCKSNTPSGTLGRIRILENNTIISESTDIQNIQIEDNCYVNSKFIGTTVAKKVTVNLFNDDNKYDLENKEIEVKLGFQHYDQKQIYQGKQVQIDNAKPVKPYITLHGETNQATRSGKNKFNKNDLIAGYVSTSATTDIITGSSNCSTSQKIYINGGTDITFSTTGVPTDIVIYVFEFDSSGNLVTKSMITTTPHTKTLEANTSYVRLRFDKAISVIQEYDSQLEIGSTATAYEPYGASPSPDYPSEIENVEGKNKLKNEITSQTSYGVTITVNDDKSITLNGTAEQNHWTTITTNLSLPANNYTLSLKNKIPGLGLYLGSSANTQYAVTQASTDSIKQFALTEEAVFDIARLRIYAGTVFDNLTVYPMLVKGTYAENTMPEYVPYNSLAVKVTGKNLFDVNTIISTNTNSETNIDENKVTITATGTTGAQYARNFVTRLDSSKEYTLSFKAKKTVLGTDGLPNILIRVYGSNDGTTYTSIRNITQNNPTLNTEYYLETTVTGYSYYRFYIYNNASTPVTIGEQTEYYDIQFEEGAVATSYEPYKEQTVYFPLSEGQKLMEGSYLAENGVHNVRGQVVLDGTEDWFYVDATYDYMYIAKTSLEKIQKSNGVGVCSHFKYSVSSTDIGTFRLGNNYGFMFYTEYTDVTEWKTWLFANPITVEYELAKEEIVPYTEEQQKAWNNMKKLNLYSGTNHINSNANMLVILEKEEFISYGNFIIEKPETEEVEAKTNFIGYDYMIKFNKLFIDNNTYPITLGEYFSNLCNQVGVEAGNTDFVNSDYMVQGNAFTNNEDCKTVLSAIAQIAGGIAKIGRDNKAYIINLSKGDILEEIDGNNYDTFTPNKVFGPINKVILKMNSGVDGEESVRSDEESIIQNGECAMTISDNPILNSAKQRELVIDNILNALKGITYLPFKTSYYGYPYSDSTDKIKILNVNDTEYDSYIFNHTIVYDGAFTGNIDTSALTKTQSMYKNTIDLKTRFKRTELEVDKINGKITSILEEQEDTKGKINIIEQDIDSTTLRIGKIEDETTSQINELKATVHGVTNTLTNRGGNNIFYYDEASWSSEGTFNIEEVSDTEIQQNSVSGMGYIINSGSSYQTANVQNGTYTVSFKYKKIGPELANASVKINDKEYSLAETNWTDFSEVIEVKSNYIKVEFISDTNDTLYIVDLLGNAGSEKEIWTQNPNEIRTDTVKIGKGIEIESTERNTIHKIGADGNRTYNKETGELVAELTDKGLEAEEIISRGQAQIAGVLIKQVRKSNMVFEFIIKLKNEQ